MSAFQLLGAVEEEIQTKKVHNDECGGASIQMLILALTALSKRTLIAISSCFTFACVASVWYLLYVTMPEPTLTQLYGIAGYAVFVLLLEFIRRK